MNDETLRIAFREEGEFINAYLAPPDTMEGKLHVGAMRKSALEGTPGAFKEYQALMRSVVANATQAAGLGAPAEWRTKVAPPHERSPESRKNDPPGSSYRVDVPENVQKTLQEMAQQTDILLPPGWGFGLFVFTFGEGGTLAWISNAQRGDMVKTLQEWMRAEGD